MKDYLLLATDKAKQVRVFIAKTTNLVDKATKRHKTSATASAALGRVITAAAIMGISDLKSENSRLTIRVNGNGIAGAVLATADNNGNVRGLISNPSADLPSISPGKLNVGGIIGKDGKLEVIKDLGMQQPFVGSVALVNGEIGEDLAHYYLMSEQLPSLVSLGVLVAPELSIQAAGGLIIQAMPNADDELLRTIEGNVLKMGTISKFINEKEDLKSILDIVLDGIEYEIIIKDKPLAFRCECNRERLLSIVASMPENEIEETFEEQGKLEISCNFCNETYLFTKDIIEEAKK
ncbi:hypothetical protein SYNTR_0476 [Candidatus Syntrophocurvum alkaliphilum]|uniref:33 kDa chaperonin n=1 Tax=Candidatus Syntrophocurvum alkaliphilum TaxID=2293317 RepID=A0A6I6DHH7_9FIRM|nr:Hsp33 family molecular chaperone HslO [Candidatus Syntrophocurvum alkaliphilum]QGT99069.1 hypothetical protein SYNTR_0476 [Candidatus Syntrophocurvum alkaliphilum]